MTAQTTIQHSTDVEFSRNWNKKLNCDFFPTIRCTNTQKYYPGAVHRVICKGEYCFNAQIVSVQHTFLKDLPNMYCLMDAGHTHAETKALMKSIYPKYDFDKYTISIIIYRKLD